MTMTMMAMMMMMMMDMVLLLEQTKCRMPNAKPFSLRGIPEMPSCGAEEQL